MPPPRVTTCTGRGHSVAAPLQAAQLVIVDEVLCIKTTVFCIYHETEKKCYLFNKKQHGRHCIGESGPFSGRRDRPTIYTTPLSLKPALKVKEVDLYSAFIEVSYTQGAQVRITQCYLQITPYLPLPRKHSPDGASPD